MGDKSNNVSTEKVPFETALDKAGYGLYSYIMIMFAGVAIISFVSIVYSSNIIVPTSACELGTTGSQQGLLAAGPIVGSLGGVVWGYLADTRGRRKMLMISLLGATVFNLIASISVNWVMLLILQFLAAIFASGIYSVSMSLLSESVPINKRNLVVLLVTSIFILAQGIMAVLAIPIIPLSFSFYLPALGIYWNSWRTLLAVYSLPCIVSAVWLFFIKESPKYTYIQGDQDKALEILRTIHRINHWRSKEELQVKGLLEESESQVLGAAPGKNQILPLFKKPLVKYTIIMFILFVFQQVGAFLVWLPRIADQFVRIVQTGENSDLTMCGIITMEAPVDADAVPCALNEFSLLIVLGVGVMQSLCNIIISTVVNAAGRRNIVMVITSVCGVSGILVNLVPNAIGSAVLLGVLVMGVVVYGLYTAIVVSLFPAHLRALAIALAVTGGRLGTFASVQILNLLLSVNCDAGFYLFASLFASSAIIASLLPDDRRLQKPNPPEIKEEASSNEDTTKRTDE